MGRTACTEPQCLYSTAIPLLLLWGIRPVQSLSACTSLHFAFFSTYIYIYIYIYIFIYLYICISRDTSHKTWSGSVSPTNCCKSQHLQLTSSPSDPLHVIIIFLHGLGRLSCSGIDALPSFPGASTVSSSSRFVVEGVFRQSGVVHSFKVVDPVFFCSCVI